MNEQNDSRESHPETRHLDAIIGRLTRERQKLAEALTEKERVFRGTQVAQAEKELAAEYVFLGVKPEKSDDELLAELASSSV